jgi:hypothetical protein
VKRALCDARAALAATLIPFACLASATSTTAGPEDLRQQRPDVVGEAVDPKTGETLYLEYYYCTDDALKCSVVYLRPNQELIASKQLDYEPSLKAPELTFRDFRTDRELSISPPDQDVVVDAGFDNFVRLQWQDLMAGEEVVFPFRLVNREKPLTMRASREDGECADGQLCLQVRLDSWLLGALVDPIELIYDRGSQRLRRFQGISNLKSDEGRSQKVEIRYQYADEVSGDAGSSEP